MARSSQFDVFLAHSSLDKPVVRQIAESLRQRGLHPWLDEWELRPGMSWQDSLQEAISDIKAVAVLIGGEGLGPWQKLELRAFLTNAIDRGVPIIPVLLPGASDILELPSFLKAIHYLDLRKGLSETSLDRFEWGITGRKPINRATAGKDENIDLFLCFVNADRKIVQDIAKALKRKDVRLWPDDWSLSPDESWERLLSRDFHRIRALAVFAGDNGGPWVDDQVESFIWELLEADQLVLPIILPNATFDPRFPVYLRRRNILDLRRTDSDLISELANQLSVNSAQQKGAFDG